jgi:hypothetical protein
MLAPPHPEVLAAEYVPPTLLGRSREVEALLERLGGPTPPRPMPWAASVQGPPGSGTSSVARVAAHRLMESIRRETPGPAPLLVTVRVRWCRGTQGVAAALLLHLDDGFHPSGFHVTEIAAGFLRRLAREPRPTVIVLDDIAPSAPDLFPLFRAFASPLRFLPEGADTAPPIWLLAAGVPNATGPWSQAARAGLFPGPPVRLTAYDAPMVRAIVRDRLGRAFGRDPPERLLDRLARASGYEPSNAARAMESVRRELLGHAAVVPGSVYRPAGASTAWRVEPRIVTALGRAADSGGSARLGEVREWEARLAREEGVAPMPATTLWRRLLRLEAEGLLRRDVRPGGSGGTRSVLTPLRPLVDWPVTLTGGSPRAAVPPSAPSWGAWRGGEGSPPPLPRPPWTAGDAGSG